MGEIEDNENRIEIYTKYVNSVESIMHFERQQKSFHKIASLITMGTVAANWTLIFSGKSAYHTNHFLILTVLNFFAALLIAAIWKTDLPFKNDIANINFVDGQDLEEECDLIPKALTNMLKNGKHDACPAKKVWFYIMLESIMVFLIGCSLLGILEKYNENKAYLVSTALAVVGSIFFTIIMMLKKQKRFEEHLKKKEARKDE